MQSSLWLRSVLFTCSLSIFSSLAFSHPLTKAVLSGNYQKTVELLAKEYMGAKVNDRDFLTGETALLAAIKTRRVEIAMELLRHPHIDIRKVDRQGYSPLVLSAYLGLPSLVLHLLQAGARESINQALLLAITSQSNPTDRIRCVTHLLAYPEADLNHRDLLGYTALRRAVEYRHIDLVTLILQPSFIQRIRLATLLDAIDAALGSPQLLDRLGEAAVQLDARGFEQVWLTAEGKSKVCPICLEGFLKDQMVATTLCGHRHHYACLLELWMENAGAVRCAGCNQRLATIAVIPGKIIED
ncbi:MAG: ankyrin repeat domain-containing protein [Oligoflexales bacterium]|nr:ankyrin repeat domain-containing protein [Oligoflexales bacterium]